MKQREIEFHLRQFLKNKTQEEMNIKKAQQYWEIIRKKKMVINIIYQNNGDKTLDKMKLDPLPGSRVQDEELLKSKLIIAADNPMRL